MNKNVTMLLGFILSLFSVVSSEAQNQSYTNDSNQNLIFPNLGNSQIISFRSDDSVQNSNRSIVDKVLVLWADGFDPIEADFTGQDIINTLLTAGVPQVDFFNFTPTNNYPVLDLYWNYDAILVAKEVNGNPEVFADVLAVYADGGGGVVDLLELAGGPFELLGRFNEDYMIWNAPNDGSAYEINEQRTLGTVINPSHPIMQGVNTFSGGARSLHFNGDPENGGQILAEYDNGESLVVINESMGPHNAKRVFLNFNPLSDNIDPDFWDSSTDGGLLMKNALDWVANENRFNGCGEINLSVSDGFNIEYNASSASAIKAATDLTVKRNTDFELTKITANIASNGPIESIATFYYDNNGGLPGTLLDSQSGITPSSQEVIGSEGGFDIYKVVIEVPSYTFNGQIGNDTTYWIELSVTNDTASQDVFWVATSTTQVNNSMALDSGSGWTIPSNSFDGVYLFEGNCTNLFEDECNQSIPVNYLFESGTNCSSAFTNFKTANDILIGPNNSFDLSQILFNVLSNDPITTVDVFYYDDNNGLPGNIIGTETGIVPTYQNVIGINYLIDMNEVILDVTPFQFQGNGTTQTTYWIELSTSNTNQSIMFWETTSKNNIGNPTAFFQDNQWSYLNSNFDGVATFIGSCILGTEDFATIDFIASPVPADHMLSIESSKLIAEISIYSMLGQPVLLTQVNAQETTLDVSRLPAGSYILRATTSENEVISKSILIK